MATARLALAALLLAGCPAEQLGVPVPPRGLEAINQEDLQRDLYHLLEAGPEHERSPEAGAWVAERFEQMHLEPVPLPLEGAVCGLRPGRGDGSLLVLSQPAPAGASRAALPDAAVISLAKSTDGLPTPRRGIMFCSVPQGGFGVFWGVLTHPDELVFIHRIGGEILSIESQEWEVPSTAVRTIDGPAFGEEDGMESLNYVLVAEHLREVHAKLLDPELTPPD